MGAFGQDHYEQLGGDLVADMMGKLDFTGLEFDPTVLDGDSVGHAFAAMDFEQIQGLGGKALDAVGNYGSADVGRWDPQAAFNVFSAGDFDQVKGLGQIDGLVGAMGHEFLGQVEGDKLVELFDGFKFGGEDFENRAGALGGQGSAGLMGGMDRSHLDQVGGQGILEAMGHIGNLEDLGVMGGENAFDVLGAVGLGDFQGLPQFDGLVANFGRDQIDGLGQEFGQVLESLDFQNNGALLGDFSFEALDGLFATAGGGPFGGGDLRVPDHLADLANSVGGGQIFHLHPDKLEGLLDEVDPTDFSNFDPAAFSGIFAGLDQDRIADFDPGRAQAAIDAAGANFLGGSGGFGGISGGDTAFDQIAGAQDSADDFLSVEWAAIFGGNLFDN
ncbi:MAG: hypothetical protein H8E48_00285 [Chloroflexi bacterium]|nr:hypothetical protein [Chloroflexota bacterium]